jgi:Fuc2NAc and GlcNAc transferase
MLILFFSFAIFFASLLITGIVRYYSLHKSILDVPNERSSHTIPTPRGGGIAIAITFFVGVSWLGWHDLISLSLTKALLGGGLLVAATGYWDDLKSVSARTRFFLHLLAAIWTLYCLGGFSTLVIGNWSIHLGWLGSVIAAIGVVWLINLYNFMDGIDGIAGSEAVFVAGAAGSALFLLGATGLAAVCFFLCAACLGFLLWNWAPAKIFLGDVGSGLLGFIFAVLILASANQHAILLFPWLILLAVFIFDATLTLIHRSMRGQQLSAAHREHLYHRLMQFGFSHKKVVIVMLLFNLFILLPLFYFSLQQPKLSLWLFLFAGVLFTLIWYRIIVFSQQSNGLNTVQQ